MQIALSFVAEITPDEIKNETQYWNHRGYQNVEARVIPNPAGGKQIIWYGTKTGTCTCELTGWCPTCR